MNFNEKKLQYQLYLAKENPEPIFDVSSCGLSTVPQGTFSLCKVLRKKKVLLNNNEIKDLSSNNNNICDLIVVTHLYLQYNLITKLPTNIDKVQYLQVLNLENNLLKELPNSIINLKFLRKIYLKKNDLSKFPVCLCWPESPLTTLDIRENHKIRKFSSEIVKLKKLEVFLFSKQNLDYPSYILSKSISDIINYECQSANLELDVDVYHRLSNDESADTENDLSCVDSGVLEYEKFKQKRIDYLESIEKECNKLVDQYNHLVHKSTSEKDLFMKKVLDEESKINDAIIRLNKDRKIRTQKFLEDFKSAEKDVKNLIEEIRTINKACRSQDEIFDKIEEEKLKKYHEYQAYKEGLKNLRKKEIIAAMNQILESQEQSSATLNNLYIHRENMKEYILSQELAVKNHMGKILLEKKNRQDEMLSELEKQNIKQREAFQELQLRKDMQTLRLMEEISCIESELMLLSQMEQKRKNEINLSEKEILANKRYELVKVLEMLFHQKEQREMELKKRLIELEEQRQNTQTDYWLIQYQRLLDSKPYYFQEENTTVDPKILQILKEIDAQEYLPFFQREKVTWLQLCNYQEDDLIKLCITNKNKRNAIIDKVKATLQFKTTSLDDYSNKYDMKSGTKTPCNYSSRVDESNKMKSHMMKSEKMMKQNSLPDFYYEEVPEKQEVVVRKEEECCICLNDKASALFIKCGHICCCFKCCNLIECPMCRQKIVQIILLHGV